MDGFGVHRAFVYEEGGELWAVAGPAEHRGRDRLGARKCLINLKMKLVSGSFDFGKQYERMVGCSLMTTSCKLSWTGRSLISEP